MPTKSAQARSSNSWRSVQSAIKVKKKTRLALFVLGFILLILILGQIVNLTKTFFSPWKLSEPVKKHYIWDGQFNINLLLKSNPISVISFNPQEEKLFVLEIPQELYLDVPHDFGKWQLRSIYDLGNSSKFGGNTLLKESVSNLLGVPIDGILEPSNLKQKNGEELVKLIRSSPLNIFNTLSNFKTDLTLWELIRLKIGFSQVRFDKVKLSAISSEILDQVKLADGSTILIADPIKIDSILSDFVDPQLQNEHISIAVFNTTDYPGLAQKAARMITNIGGSVIITSNASQRQSKSQISGSNSKTLKRLVQIFDSACQNGKLGAKCDKIDLKDLGLDSSRAQINVVLGEDFYQK